MFYLNQDQPRKEKVIFWSKVFGYTSEDSEDEMVHFRATERQFDRIRQKKH